jgi:tight adherence protein C
MQLVLIIFTFLFTVILVVAVGSFLDRGRGQVQDRLAGISKMSVDADPEDILKMPFMQRVGSPALSGIGHFFGRVAPGEIRARVDKRIIHAGKPWNLNFFSLFAVQVLLGGASFIFSIYLSRLMQAEGGRMALLVIILTFAGFYLPYFVVNSKADSRQQVIRRSLPDVLDLLLVSVEAGLGFDMAMKKVTQQMPGPLSAEIKGALDEIRMGGSREEAFRGIARRSGVSELSSFISSIIQAEQLGSNIANTLRVQADFMRMKRRQRAEEMAMKAPVKLVFPLVLFIFPSLFVVILGPAAIRIFQTLITGF